MNFVNYEKAMGEYTLPEGLEKRLSGLSPEEQLPFFYTAEYRCFENTGWTSRTEGAYLTPAEKCAEVKGLIVDDGIIVGARIRDEYGCEVNCFINQCVCTYSTEENNGAGYKTRDDYTYFVVAEK